MMSDRLLALLRERLGFVTTKWSIVRIAVFAVAGLVAASLVIPARPGSSAQSAGSLLNTRNTRNVALPLGDTRGFRPTHRPGAFQVAWVGGSETQAVGPRTRAFIPDLVSRRIKSVDGKKVSTDLYYLDAIRLVDEFSALSIALASKPDLVVVSLNPVWVLNDLAVQQWGYLDGTLARHSAWPVSRWPAAASLVSPGDAGWRVLSRLSLSAVGDRFEYGVELADQTADLTFLDTVEGAAPPERTELGTLALRRPVDFFFSYFNPSNKGTSLAATQLGILEREVASESSFNRKVVQQMLDIVDRAGVDAYFYVPPIDPSVYAKPDAKKYIAELRELLSETTKGRTSERIVFDPQGLQDRVPATKYKDIVHVLNGKNEAGVLAEDLCALLVARGKQPGCEGP